MIENLELKVGQRVICIKEEAYFSKIKQGKLYVIKNVTISRLGNEYWVVTSDGYDCGWILPVYFKLISEIRSEKLEELGI